MTFGVAQRVSRACRSGCLLAWLGLACGDDAPASSGVPGPDGGGGAAGAVMPGEEGEGGTAAASGAGGAMMDGGTPAAESCVPGETRMCSLDFLCTGQQTCRAEGAGFEACECSREALIGSGVVGAACEQDADCGPSGTCFTASGNQFAGEGGPPRGYCTAACADTAECAAIDPLSRCVPGLGPLGASYCVRTCQSKEPAPGEAKCLNRPEIVCLSIAADGAATFSAARQEGVCVPRCGSDADCPVGRFCHAQSGLCLDFDMSGAPTGARCTLGADCESTECIAQDDDGVGTCSAPCTLGALSGCGFGRDAALREAACITPLLSGGGFSEGPGDVGVCQELCDVAADCQRAAEGWVCAPFTEPLAALFGRVGACVPAPAD